MIAPDFYPYADLSRTYPGQPDRAPNGARPGASTQNGRGLDDVLVDFLFSSPKEKNEQPSQRRQLEARYYDLCGR
jgi:hypothetical protein